MDGVPSSFADEKAAIPYDPQMLRDGPLRDIQASREGAYAKRPALQSLHDPHPGGCGQSSAEPGKLIRRIHAKASIFVSANMPI